MILTLTWRVKAFILRGALKHVEFFSSDKGLEFDYHFDPGDDAGRNRF
jgi:hypothetical protein